jgi:stearoyl-CoA desaturase (delta-9 desaturase)
MALVAGSERIVADGGADPAAESWRNNHHAFPGSARLGLDPGQVDLGWRVVRVFAALGLARDIVTPERLPPREALRWVTHEELIGASACVLGQPT